MALFGLKYYGELRSKHQGIIWRVEIAQRGYVGNCEEMTFCGSDPIKVTWEKRGDDFYVPVKASEASVTILCKDNFHYMGLFTADARYYRMSIFRDGQLYWHGCMPLLVEVSLQCLAQLIFTPFVLYGLMEKSAIRSPLANNLYSYPRILKRCASS